MTTSAPVPALDRDLIARLRFDVIAASWTTDTLETLLSDGALSALMRDSRLPALVELAGVTAVSSMTTPTAFEEALTAFAATSSIDEAVTFARVAISSSSATSPPDMGFPPLSLTWGSWLGTRALYAWG